jgi:hypothetical protein
MVGELLSIALFCLPALLGLFFVLFRVGVLARFRAPEPEISVPQMMRASRAQWIAAEHELMRGWEMQCNCPEPQPEVVPIVYLPPISGPSGYCVQNYTKDYRCREEEYARNGGLDSGMFNDYLRMQHEVMRRARDTAYAPIRSGPYSPARKPTRPAHQA